LSGAIHRSAPQILELDEAIRINLFFTLTSTLFERLIVGIIGVPACCRALVIA
jgi:hypothetical protein